MIIQFPNGAGIDSSAIAAIHTLPSSDGQHPQVPRIVVHVFKSRDMFGDLWGRGSKQPSIEHFMIVDMPSDAEAAAECTRLVAQWAGRPIIETAKAT